MLVFQLLPSNDDAVESFVGSNYFSEEYISPCKISYTGTNKTRKYTKNGQKIHN